MEKMFIDLTTGKIILSTAGGLNSQYHGWRNAQYPEGLYYSNGQLYALSLEEFISRFGSWNPGYHPRFYLSEDLSNHKAWALEYIDIMSSPAGKECVFEFCYGDRRYAILINMQRQERAWPKFNAIDDASLINLRRKLTDISVDIAPMLNTHWKPLTIDAFNNDDTISGTISNEIKKAQQKMMEEILLKEGYHGGFTTKTDPFTIVKMLPHEEKETKTMEKKMTETDSFLKRLNGITITSTYSKLDHGCGRPYYIYYPKMEITEDIADTLLTVLLMAKREYIHKIVFNPEKGTTTIYRNYSNSSVTVKCRDSEFDYILGYDMARTKLYLGSDDYNWFNKIKNHRKTHIEYTEKKPTKKGGKK